MDSHTADNEAAGSASSAQRVAKLVLVAQDGGIIGALPHVVVSTPWWQDVEPVIEAVQKRFGINVTILRLLEAELVRPPGGKVTYVAEVTEQVTAEPWQGTLPEHALRQSFARPGGPAADLAWAESELDKRGLRLTGRPMQVRTWSLSSLWRIPLPAQTGWLKVVPPFFAHEGELLARMPGQLVPTLLSHSGARSLLAEVRGVDLYDAEPAAMLVMVKILVGIQHSWTSRVQELLTIGLPDWREPPLSAAIESVLRRNWKQLSHDDRASLTKFMASLTDRFSELAACGLDDGLVHGDFHPGNFRGQGQSMTLLDWGDSGVGHPLLDQAVFLSHIPGSAVQIVRNHWSRQWLAAVPDSNPARASLLIAPVAMARQAVIYQGFLDHIEPVEYPYHQSDPAEWLHRAALCVRSQQ